MTTHEPPPTEPLLTIAEAAERLHLGKGTLYRWHSAGINRQLFVHLRSEPGKRPPVRVDPAQLRHYVHANGNVKASDR